MVKSNKKPKEYSRKPAITPEARENQLISLAVDLAEKQLAEGTASAQVITHYLKLGSSEKKLEKKLMEKQTELLTAKTELLHKQEETKEVYERALAAIKEYGGRDD